MNLRDTIAKQQEVWIHRLDGMPHHELHCHFCDNMEEVDCEDKCKECPVVRILMPKWTRVAYAGYDACFYLDSWRNWHYNDLSRANRRKAARLVLDDVNRIARHYHYPVREP
jgi:hypothetical protein